MISYLICFGLFVLIVILVLYLSHGSDIWQDMTYKKNMLLDSCVLFNQFRNVRIVNGPVLCVKCPGEMEYRKVPVVNRTIKIGSSKSSDLVLRDEFVEPIHAVIKKVVRDNDCHYELINMSKYNPVQWFNQTTNDYETIHYRHGVILDSQEVFYVGESKVIVKCPITNHKPSNTERLILNREAFDDSKMHDTMKDDDSEKFEPTKRLR